MSDSRNYISEYYILAFPEFQNTYKNCAPNGRTRFVSRDEAYFGIRNLLERNKNCLLTAKPHQFLRASNPIPSSFMYARSRTDGTTRLNVFFIQIYESGYYEMVLYIRYERLKT